MISFILDKSGSMCTVTAATISSFNEYKNQQKGKFSLTLFDTIVEGRYATR